MVAGSWISPLPKELLRGIIRLYTRMSFAVCNQSSWPISQIANQVAAPKKTCQNKKSALALQLKVCKSIFTTDTSGERDPRLGRTSHHLMCVHFIDWLITGLGNPKTADLFHFVFIAVGMARGFQQIWQRRLLNGMVYTSFRAFWSLDISRVPTRIF